MKLKTFVILAVVCGVLAAASYMVLQPEKKRASDKTGDILLTDFPVNDITQILIQTPTETVSLKKGESVWEIEERYGYPADFAKITALVKKIRDMKIGRSFKATDDVLSRQSLLLPDKEGMPEEQLGVRITCKDKTGKVVGDLILGKARESEKAQGGHFVMPVGAETVYIVDADFKNLEKKPADWVKKNLLDIKAEEIGMVTGSTADGQLLYTLKRPEKGKPPEFVNPPEGKKLIPTKPNLLFQTLSSMNIDDVADPALDGVKSGLAKGRCFAFYLYNGLRYTLCTGNPAEGTHDFHYMRVSVDYENPETWMPKEAEPEVTEENPADSTAEKPEAASSDENAKADGKKEDPARVKAEAEKLNATLDKWIFVLPQWTYNRMIKNVDDFFEKPKEETPPAASQGTPPKVPLIDN